MEGWPLRRPRTQPQLPGRIRSQRRSATSQFSSTKVVYNLDAPSKPGKYTICAAFLYGTEKASPLGRVDVHGHTQPLGGFAGKSGRIKFTGLKSFYSLSSRGSWLFIINLIWPLKCCERWLRHWRRRPSEHRQLVIALEASRRSASSPYIPARDRIRAHLLQPFMISTHTGGHSI